MADGDDTLVGVLSGFAAGFLIVALTVMALFAFQPQPTGARATEPTAAVSSTNR